MHSFGDKINKFVFLNILCGRILMERLMSRYSSNDMYFEFMIR